MILFNIFDHEAQVPKLVFVLVVAVIAVAPRMPLDEPYSIGGRLSNSFRKTLLLIVSSYIIRLLIVTRFSKDFGVFLMGCESVLISFLSLLLPYLLRVWMRDRVNVPGGRQPGKALMPWVQALAVLTFMAVILRIWSGNQEFWVFKKIADVLSFIPVVRTLKLYNTITSPHGSVRYPGRGSVLSQVVVVAEYYALFANGTDALAKLANISGLLSDDFLRKSTFIRGMYMDNLFAMYTRILCHSILLNVLDEAYILASLSSSSTTGQTTSDPTAGARSPPGMGTQNPSSNQRGVSSVESTDRSLSLV